MKLLLPGVIFYSGNAANSFSPGLGPGPRWGSSLRSPRPSSWLGRRIPPPHSTPLDAFGVSVSVPLASKSVYPRLCFFGNSTPGPEYTLYCLGQNILFGGYSPESWRVRKREPSGGLAAMPQWDPGAKPMIRGRGRSPLKLKVILKLNEQYCALDLTVGPFGAFRYFVHHR